MATSIDIEKWVTYTRTHHSNGSLILSTKLSTEKRPTGFSEERLARPAEITAEKRKRKEREEHAIAFAKFEERPDYKAACAIRNALEFMSLESNPLERLTIEEWEQLRTKLTS